ncbi:MAG: DUF1294 domain-containing protein [Candidatus Magasanikbacteria bacterium CG_4_9_14_0_2_um_filter_41_10]|uniref:DUF1294 domain-containing protein n=1 Tax=Candidatus Magasanikbacteria bacterium CG_4_10_14_0_2_um_filter_41_31 TaxID=1974639 RepID=A0A2M7V500_9BACT|nr:MAG: hypothetical protein AUJ37_05060 [Candidatus Magasanikbacteria bacterium CG1_02_41_34]PIZ93611.1 MAG: DUF1294 domain-containing protein [Candidatus Magasanikbacteria bacterium CG_4_10_14_0_2_um_filter_41_31]PJC53654.1 MAG: DUF1294 domain-containing protein [Candidatus Magasanikbacteria bacterium CG_4_9_14_0_2_um_filter_41_10]
MIYTGSSFFVLYALAVSTVSFFYIGRDKEHARHGGTRTPEVVLWFLAAIGGTPGIFLGMKAFHHKTKKISFQLILAFILLTQLGGGLFFLQQTLNR